MKRIPYVFAVVVAAAILAAPSPSAQASENEKGPKPKVTALLKTALAGVKGKEVHVMHIVAPPGFTTSKHTHSGQLLLYVVRGTVSIDVDGKPPLKLGPGDIVEEPRGKAMVGRNASSTHDAELIVFQIGDKGKPLSADVK